MKVSTLLGLDLTRILLGREYGSGYFLARGSPCCFSAFGREVRDIMWQYEDCMMLLEEAELLDYELTHWYFNWSVNNTE
jgi:hypothetical protein